MARSVRTATKYILAGDYEVCAAWAASAELDLVEWANVPSIGGPSVRVYALCGDIGPLAAHLAAERQTAAGDEHRRAAANSVEVREAQDAD